MTRIAAILCFIFIIICSCASGPASGKHDLYVYLTDSSRFTLLPTEGIETPMDTAQFISASFQGQDYFFNAWVQADTQAMGITLFNDLGASMGELSYRDGTVHFLSQVFPQSLKPEYIVADFQLCFYAPLPLKEALNKCGLDFITEGTKRRVLSKGSMIIEIEKTQDTVYFVNHLRGYRYTLIIPPSPLPQHNSIGKEAAVK